QARQAVDLVYLFVGKFEVVPITVGKKVTTIFSRAATQTNLTGLVIQVFQQGREDTKVATELIPVVDFYVLYVHPLAGRLLSLRTLNS
ncbi:hypothetical protein PSY31_23195, partial [Shigella flexneri]|nr:hypothetical protein [Shigella flexneri]